MRLESLEEKYTRFTNISTKGEKGSRDPTEEVRSQKPSPNSAFYHIPYISLTYFLSAAIALFFLPI